MRIKSTEQPVLPAAHTTACLPRKSLSASRQKLRTGRRQNNSWKFHSRISMHFFHPNYTCFMAQVLLALQDHFQYKLAAEISQQENDESTQRPANRDTAAPSV